MPKIDLRHLPYLPCYDLGRRVSFETAPSVIVEGQVYDMFTYDRMTYYMLRYQAGDEVAFVVRRLGQFSFMPAGRPQIKIEYGQDKFSMEQEQ